MGVARATPVADADDGTGYKEEDRNESLECHCRLLTFNLATRT